MQIFSTGGAGALPLPAHSLATDPHAFDAPARADQERTAAGSAAPPPEAGAGAKLSLQWGEQSREPPPGRIYAEIWKDGVKLAQIDVHGQVIAADGSVKRGGGALAGPLLAAQRAVQVARQTGGEIRAAGQPIDPQTLLMRARLANTYAV